jgi:hypothetical protein
MYAENEEETAPSQTSEQSPQGDGQDRQEGENSTFLINKEAYPEAKPGDLFTVRVERVHDQEMECSLVKEDEEKPPGGSEEAGDGMDAGPEARGAPDAQEDEGGGGMY